MGATGSVGTQLIDQGLERGHQITAFVRSPQKIRSRPNLFVVVGDLLDSDQLKRALPGHDAVLSTLGHAKGGPPTVVADAARSTVAAMRATGPRRLLVISVAFIFPDVGLVWKIIGDLLLSSVVKDHKEMERTVTQSGLDWTILGPPRFTNGPRTERYRVADGHLPPRGSTISRADLAHFTLLEAEQGAHIGKIVGIGY
jgi:putative NADH-flavin reductase